MPEEIREHLIGHKYHDPYAEHIIYLTLRTSNKSTSRYMEHVTISEKLLITMEEFRELKTENSRLNNMVSELERELKELKGEV